MRRPAISRVKELTEGLIRELISAGCDGDIIDIVTEYSNRINNVCCAEGFASKGETIRAFAKDTGLSPEDIVETDNYQQVAALGVMQSVSIRVMPDIYLYIKAMIKKNYPNYRLRSTVTPMGERVVTRIA